MSEPVYQRFAVSNSPAFGLELQQTYPWSWPEEMPRSAVNPTLAASWVAMVGQGRLIGLTVTNTKAAGQFIQLYDASSLPADGVVPIVSLSLAAGATAGIFYGESGRWMREGIVLCNSSTQGTKTIGSADCLFDVQYVPQVI